MIKEIVNRFSAVGDRSRDREKLIRDLQQLVKDINTELSDAQSQIAELKSRIDSAGIP